MRIDSFLTSQGPKVPSKARACFPEEVLELSLEQLEGISGGVLNSEDTAYCQLAVMYYHSKNYTLNQMTAEMTDYQAKLRANGQTELADLSAEYLDYMITIW